MCCFAGKFQGHPGAKGIMTGLLSSEEEVGVESEQRLLDHSGSFRITDLGDASNQIKVIIMK